MNKVSITSPLFGILVYSLIFISSSHAVTPTPTPTLRPSVTAKLTKVGSHSVIACTVKDSSGRAIPSQAVSVQKAAAITGPFANWMSKKTSVNGQAILPYAQPTYTWYVRCAAALPLGLVILGVAAFTLLMTYMIVTGRHSIG